MPSGLQNLMELAEAHTSQLKTIQGLTKGHGLLPYHHISLPVRRNHFFRDPGAPRDGE